MIGLIYQTFLNMWRHKLRSFLTMFGIAWGICSLVLMLALCDGFRQGQRKNMSQIGDNLVFLYSGRTERQAGGERAGRRIWLTEQGVEAIRANCPLVETVAPEIKRYDTPVASSFNSGRFLVLGVSPEYLKLRNLPVETGRPVQARDVEEIRRVCVLGASVRKQLFEERLPLGCEIRINGYPYTVIGAMSEKMQNSSYDGWDNDKILIPITSLRRDCPPERATYRPDRVDSILYRPSSVKEWRATQVQVRRALAAVYDFDPLDESAVPVNDSVEGAELFDRVFDSGEMFLAVIALITLSLGGVSVMNTMMMAVAERTGEIGLKKALGATRHRILLDFFLEGVFLALLSGAVGIGTVWTLAGVVNSLPMPTMFSGLLIDMKSALLALAALGTVAICSAVPPAWHAAGLTPVEALREER